MGYVRLGRRIVGYRAGPVVSDLRLLEGMNFLDRNFSKLLLLYETINKFHHSLYFCSYYYYLRAARGNLGGLGSIFALELFFKITLCMKKY